MTYLCAPFDTIDRTRAVKEILAYANQVYFKLRLWICHKQYVITLILIFRIVSSTPVVGINTPVLVIINPYLPEHLTVKWNAGKHEDTLIQTNIRYPMSIYSVNSLATLNWKNTIVLNILYCPGRLQMSAVIFLLV